MGTADDYKERAKFLSWKWKMHAKYGHLSGWPKKDREKHDALERKFDNPIYDQAGNDPETWRRQARAAIAASKAKPSKAKPSKGTAACHHCKQPIEGEPAIVHTPGKPDTHYHPHHVHLHGETFDVHELGVKRGRITGRDAPRERDYEWLAEQTGGQHQATDPQEAVEFAAGMKKGARKAEEEG